jgi:hypothetical protein
MSTQAGLQPDARTALSAPEVRIDVTIAGAPPVGAFEFELHFDRQYLQYVRWTHGPFIGATSRPVSCHEIITDSTVRGGCNTSGATPAGAAGDGVLASVFMRPIAPGPTCSILLLYAIADVPGNALPAAKQDGCLTIIVDSDGDGCSDAEESGANPLLGGERDGSNPWDFYDVPTPYVRVDAPAGARDGYVDISDVISILPYIGARDGGPPNVHGLDYDDNRNANASDDGREYDRTESLDPSRPWRSGPPDGVIGIADALVALRQVGHSCATLAP